MKGGERQINQLVPLRLSIGRGRGGSVPADPGDQWS